MTVRFSTFSLPRARRDGGGGLLHNWVLGREEERVLAEALWSRPTAGIGAAEEDL